VGNQRAHLSEKSLERNLKLPGCQALKVTETGQGKRCVQNTLNLTTRLQDSLQDGYRTKPGKVATSNRQNQFKRTSYRLACPESTVISSVDNRDVRWNIPVKLMQRAGGPGEEVGLRQLTRLGSSKS